MATSTLSDKYTITLPRKIDMNIVKMEEEERQRRMKEGVDPMLMTRWFRTQCELKSKVPTENFITKIRETIRGTTQKVAVDMSGNKMLSSLSTKATETFGTIQEKASDLFYSAKEKLTGVPLAGTTSGVTVLEEKERLRRMHEAPNTELQHKRLEVQSEIKKVVHPSQ